jgi:tripartite ATP-independent transporter DctM subunit
VGVWIANIPFAIVTTRLFTGVDSFIFLAVPFYILAAEIMNQGGITSRLITLARNGTRWLPGGTAYANVGTSVMFAGISGSAVADAAALGRVFMAEMPKEGYTKSYAAAVTAASSVIGPIIPPSGLAIILAAVSGLSVLDLFLAGVLPGLLIGAACCAVVAIDSLRGRVPRSRPKVPGGDRWRMLIEAVAVITLPVIIVAGMVLGAYTATEGGGIAVAYAIFLSFVVFRQMNLKSLWKAFASAARISATIYLLVAAATVLSYALNLLGIAGWVREAAVIFENQPLAFLFAIALLMLILGTFLDIGAAILIFIPLILPATYALGIDPLQMSMVVMVTLAIGLITPPVGVVLFVMIRVGNISMMPLMKALLPFLVAQLVAVALLCLVPEISTWLPSVLNP